MSRHCLLFDMDGVLVDYDPHVRIAHLAAALDRTAAAVHAAIYTSGIEARADRGQLDAQAYLTALGDVLETHVTQAAWVAARRAATCVRPELLARAKSLDGHAQIALLTNNGLLMAAHWAQIVPALFPLFEGRAYAAAQFGVAKPDPLVYTRCLAAIGVAAEATLFIDDNEPNIEGARQAGLQAHHYIDEPSLHQAISAFLEL